MVARMRALPDELPSFFLRVIPIHRQTKSARVATGVVVPVNRPFFGTMGVAPLPVMGRISSSPPGVHTGNIDNKDLIAGTTLFTPVFPAYRPGLVVRPWLPAAFRPPAASRMAATSRARTGRSTTAIT